MGILGLGILRVGVVVRVVVGTAVAVGTVAVIVEILGVDCKLACLGWLSRYL